VGMSDWDRRHELKFTYSRSGTRESLPVCNTRTRGGIPAGKYFVDGSACKRWGGGGRMKSIDGRISKK